MDIKSRGKAILSDKIAFLASLGVTKTAVCRRLPIEIRFLFQHETDHIAFQGLSSRRETGGLNVLKNHQFSQWF